MGCGGHLRLPVDATRAAAGAVVRWAIVLFADRLAVQRARLRYDALHNVFIWLARSGCVGERLWAHCQREGTEGSRGVDRRTGPRRAAMPWWLRLSLWGS